MQPQNDYLQKTIKHYTIDTYLGGGGMWRVYKARDLKLHRDVVLKFLHPQVAQNSIGNKRFLREARAASAIEHVNICTIHDIDETDDGQYFIVMAYYEGRTLKELIDDGPLPVDVATDIMIQIINGLSKAHAKGIIHRDLKPANILITPENTVKILDFGIARLLGQTRVTQTGAQIGTVKYMSPEQARGDPVDHRTDIWSLGILLYEMIVGSPPYDGAYDQGIIYSILSEEYTPVENVAPGVPKYIIEIINTALSKDPADRYASVDDIRHILISARNGQHSIPHLKRWISPFLTRKKYMAVIPLFLVGILFGYAVFFTQNNHMVPQQSKILPASATNPVLQDTLFLADIVSPEEKIDEAVYWHEGPDGGQLLRRNIRPVAKASISHWNADLLSALIPVVYPSVIMTQSDIETTYAKRGELPPAIESFVNDSLLGYGDYLQEIDISGGLFPYAYHLITTDDDTS